MNQVLLRSHSTIMHGVVFAAVLVALAKLSVAQFSIVHLFEWRFDDIAKECEQFLGPYGFEAIQVSPVNEYAVLSDRPWWERYQPFSYRIISRSGDEDGFKEMCERCNKAGIKVYVDVLLNHMSANQSSGTNGTGGSEPDTENKDYSDVPYTSEHFHSTCSISDYNDADEVRNCELDGLHDLDQSQEYVREKLIAFLDNLIDLGASGFRLDAAKHIWPADLQNILCRVKNLTSGERPFIYQEVSSGGVVTPKEYFDTGLVTEFKHGSELSNCFRGNNALKWLTNWGEDWSLMESDKALVFIDNHDTQRSDSDILTYKDAKLYKMAVGFMLAWGYGTPRIMSSYGFSTHDQGPPADDDGSIKNVIFNSDLTCSNGWICEHRWRQIYSMVKFGNVVNGTSVTNFTAHADYQISFCRGNKGFVVFNGESSDLSATIQTCLPAGTYCDVISGLLENGTCTGKSIEVDSDGTAQISLGADAEDGILAIHLESEIGFIPATDSTMASTISSSSSESQSENVIGSSSTTESTAASTTLSMSSENQSESIIEFNSTTDSTLTSITSSVSSYNLSENISVSQIIEKYDNSYAEFRTFLCQSLKADC